MWEFLLYSRLGLKEQLGRSCFRIGAKHCFDTLCDFFFFFAATRSELVSP